MADEEINDIEKIENRVMGDYSIAKSFKGILRIGHILDLMKDQKDEYFNPTYYGRPNFLLNISGGAYESNQNGYPNPIKGMDGTISRYAGNSEEADDLKDRRVPMTDSMGNYLNWNIGLDGVTIGNNEDINGHEIDLTEFQQNDFIPTYRGENEIIWQKKIFPVLESKELIIGLRNKDHPSEKKRITIGGGLILQNKKQLAELIIENKYDKRFNETFADQDNNGYLTLKVKGNPNIRSFAQYDTEAQKQYDFRTIYRDDKSLVESNDVFIYRQDNYDVHNYDYTLNGAKSYDREYRGNEELLDDFNFNDDQVGTPKKRKIDTIVGITNFTEYVKEAIQKYMNSSLVEVPTGTIINQYCSLDKWYADNDDGGGEAIGEGSYAGHRPPMMGKRDEGLKGTTSSYTDSDYSRSTIQGASKNINHLINPNYSSDNQGSYEDKIKDTAIADQDKTNLTAEEKENTINTENVGYYREVIPLYKRDYVLCDGSAYAVYLWPEGFYTAKYPNRRETLKRFINLFFCLGYAYTTNNSLINRRFHYRWYDADKVYKVIRAKRTVNDNKELGEDLITEKNAAEYIDDYGNVGVGAPWLNENPTTRQKTDHFAVFAEDMVTILAFEELYKKYSEASKVDFPWDNQHIGEWLAQTELPEEYRLTSFICDTTENLMSEFINRTNLIINDEFLMQMPYVRLENKDEKGDIHYPIINMGREVKTFGDPIKFWDEEKEQYVIVEAYKLPQIQYLIDLFVNYPTPDILAEILNNYYCYKFQVPNLTKKEQPTFVGSTGFEWSDRQCRKIIQVQSWSSSYCHSNTMHRHFVFTEPAGARGASVENVINPSNGVYYNKFPIDERDNQQVKLSVKPTDFVSAWACYGGEVICETAPPITQEFKFGDGDNPNYIWNELGKGAKFRIGQRIINTIYSDKINLHAYNINGMRYAILQGKTSSKLGVATGEYRAEMAGENAWQIDYSGDTRLINSDAIKIYGTANEIIDLKDEIFMRDDIVKFTDEWIYARRKYDLQHWYGWELDEDPRFESMEPNRGRTSLPISTGELQDCISFRRYQQNVENFNITLNSKSAEWFSPENVKMLPLIKL